MVDLQDSDSAGIKIEGAVINATIFVVFVGVMTFALVLLFKYGVSQYAAHHSNSLGSPRPS